MSGHIVLAQTMYEMGRLSDAKTEFEAALALDPENLIALRHLGDIARQSGDPRTARNWYQRVLEADPRNAEIVDVLASLRTTPMASAAAISAIPPTPLSTPVAPPPVSAPTPPAPAPVAEAAPVDEEHELMDLDSIALGETPLSTPVVKPMADEATAAADSPMTFEHSAPDLELDAEMFEADAFAIASPSAAAPESDVARGGDTAPDETAAEETAGAEPPIESATDLNLGLIEDEFTPASTVDIEPTTLEGLRSYEAGTLIKGNDPIDKSLDTEPYYDVLHGSGRSTPAEPAQPLHETPPNDDDFAPGLVEHFETSFESEEPETSGTASVDTFEFVETPQVSATPVEGLESFEDSDEDFAEFPPVANQSSMPHADATPVDSFSSVASVTPVEPAEATHHGEDTAARSATPTSSPEVFVTETMAELYLSQGHFDSALDIYRKLLEQRPEDLHLAERIREVESRPTSRAARGRTPQAAEPVAPRGPTIREFLVSLVRSTPSVADFAPAQPVDSLVDSAGSDDTVNGSIDALFSGGEPFSNGAETSVLAEAFSEPSANTPMLEGQPAHPAASELSLDQVFKGATPIRNEAQPDGFSFDQFFAGEANSSSASPPTNTPPAEGTDDIAQFNAWLNGLKKT
jgi:tetratricopeptide (TPR) repeat protein